MAKFKTGDKVILVSDSDKAIPMTVLTYSIDTLPGRKVPETMSDVFPKDFEKMVICVWRDRNGKPQQETFYEDMLIGL